MHLGAQELIVILLIVLILFGGKKVAGLGKAMGTSLREFKEEVNKTSDAVKDGTDAVKAEASEAKQAAEGAVKAETTDRKNEAN